MPDNRLTLTIEAQNLASAAFKELRTDVRRSNEHLEQIANNTRKVTRATVNLTASQQIVKRLRGEYNLLRTEVANTAAVTRQFSTVLNSHIRAQIEAAANIERLRVGLVSISGSVSAASKQYERLVEVSRLPGINIENSLRATLQLQAIGKSGEEAVEVIREFGNAFALAGGSGRQLGGVVHGIRQIISDGSVLQRELNIITSRIALLTPIMEEAFGGNRAEDVRAFAESIGRGDDVVDVFFETILAGLKELPRAGDTAANAIENLGDTTQRVQAVIGANFLPLVRETTAAAESFLMEIEREPQIAKTIAIIEALGATFLTVAAAGTGLAAALPAIIAAIGSLGAPILIPIAAVAALTAGLVALKVASRDIETQVEQLAATFDELDTALRKNHEAIQSNQQAQVESAKSSLTTQRDAIQKHITLLEEEQASIERTIEANQRRAEQGLLPIASTGESFTTQLDNANARLDVTQKRLQEVNDALRANEEASIPIQKTTANIGTLTKAVTRLKTELEEETTFEGISQSITGGTANFQKSATALADIEVLIKQNADAFEDLGKSAASGNQEAAKSLADLNKQLDGIRDTQADRHIDNLSAAFNRLTSATDPSRKQFEAILKSAEAFVATFQGGAAVLQDDVGRASELIGNIRSQLQDLSSDEITLELHAEGAEDLTRALTDFHDLPRDVQEDAGLDARQSAEKQATAYIRAYRDSIDPAILNLVESVKLLREEVRGSIQDLEALNLRDELRIELNAENLSPVADFFTELVDLQQAAQGDLTRSQIDSLEKRSQALRQYLSDDTANFVAYASDIEAIDETLQDKSLSLLEGVVQARQAQYDDDLRSQRQVEEAKRQENEKTYDFDVFLAGLRTKSRHAASQDLIRIEERALDASSSRQLEALTRDTQQFVDMYSERGEAFRDLVADAQDLGTELQEAFDLTEQTRRLEDFRDGVADVLQDLASVAVGHIFDGFFGAADEATTAIQTFTDVFRGDIELLENDVTRLARQVEDSKIRLLRLDEDGERRIRQLERQRRSVLARGSTGNQRDAERTRQRSQDISFQIAQVREDAAVRRSRAQEDADRQRNRTIEDAVQRLQRSQERQEGESLLSEIQASLTDATVNALSSAISSGLGSLLSSPLEKIAGFLAGGLVSSLGDLFGGLFGGDGDGDGDGTGGTTALDGTLTIDKEDIALPEGALDLTGQITLALTDITAPVEAVDVTGRISAIDELSESVKLPPVPGLTGGIGRLVLPPGVDRPIVPGLVGEIAQIQLAEGLTLPTLPPLRIPVIYDIPELPEGNVEVGPLEPVGAPGETPTSASAPAEPIAGVINAELNLAFDTPVELLGVVNADLNRDFTEPVEVQAQIASLALVTALPEIDLVGRVNAEVNVLTPQPIILPGIINATVNQPPLREGSVEVGELVPVGPPGEIPTPASAAEPIAGVINAELNRLFEEPVQIAGVVNARTNIAASASGGPVGGQFRDSNEEDPENEMLDIGDLTGEIDSLSISEDAKSLIEPVLLEGEIQASLVKLFPEPILLDGIINARINYGTGANIDQGGGGGGGEGQTAPPGGQTAPRIGDFDPATPGEGAGQGGFNLTPQGGLVTNRNGGGGGGGNAIQVSLPKSTLNAIAQEKTLLELQASHKEFFQSSIAFFDNAGARGLTANQHLAGIRRALLSEDAPQVQLATESTLSSLSATLAQIQLNTQRIADAPLVNRLVEEGVAFPNDPTDPTNAALTQSPINDILGQGGLSLLSSFDAIAQNLEVLQGAANAQPADLSQMPGSTPDNPIFIIDTSRPPVQKVEVMNTVKTETKVMNDVNVKQVGVVQVTQGGEWVMQLASGSTVPVYVQGGRLVADIAGGLEGLAVQLADEEIRLNAVGAL